MTFNKKIYFKCYDAKKWNNCVVRFKHEYIRDLSGTYDILVKRDPFEKVLHDMKYYEALLDWGFEEDVSCMAQRFPEYSWEVITHDEFKRLRGRGYRRLDEVYLKTYK